MCIFLNNIKSKFLTPSWLVANFLFVFIPLGYGATVNPSIEQQLIEGKEVNVLVLMADDSAQSRLSSDENKSLPLSEQKGDQYKSSIEAHRQRLHDFKERFKSEVEDQDIEHIEDYDSLPILHIKLKSIKALERLKNNPKVKSIDLNGESHLSGANNLGLIGQPTVSVRGYNGAGTSVCVLDTGVTYTLPEFGCSSGLATPGCKVAAYVDISGANGGSLDPDGHGSNVSSIVLQVAPSSKILGLNIFTGNTAFTSDTIKGINWCINNKATYNIIALNMSLGFGSYANPVPLNTDTFGTAIASAINSGITVVAAAGNNANKSGLQLPAAYSGVISVGAVYDSPDYFSRINDYVFPSCTDVGTMVIKDKVACFSNSAYFLSLLAPGVDILGGGITDSGTSMASPHVAGAVAVIKSLYPAYTSARLLSLLQTGPKITDRNGVTNARIDLTKLIKSIRNDFNGDGISDLVWRQASTGTIGILFMSNTGAAASWQGIATDTGWNVVGTGDFNGDGIPDLLWRQTSTGLLGELFMNSNGTIKSWNGLSTGTDWNVVDTADFNGDGISDLVWRQASTGTIGILFMSNTGAAASWQGIATDTGWNVVGTGDFNGDGIPDLLWRQTSTGLLGELFMNSNGTIKSWNGLSTGTDWNVVDTADFNGDGISDLVWRQASTGTIGILFMSNTGAAASWQGIATDTGWNVVGTGDFNGDGIPDLLWRQTSTGLLGELFMNSNGTIKSWNGLSTGTDWNETGK